MNTTQTLFGKEAREALKKGMDTVCKPVAASMGARGRNNAFREYGSAVFSNDGVTIANNINPKDEFERLGADFLKQAADATNREAGDGTSTSIVLAHSIIEQGLAEIDKGENPMIVRKELHKAKDQALAALKEIATEIKDDNELLAVTNISVEDEVVAKIVSESVRKAGKYGAVMVEEGVGYDLSKEEIRGYSWSQGFVSPYMITNERMEAVLDNPAVIITDRLLNLNKDLVGVLNELLKQGTHSALVVADNVDGELLASLIQNKVKGNMTVVAVKRPPTLDELEDLATLTEGTAVTKDKGIKSIAISHVGSAERVVITRNSALVIGKESPWLNDRVSSIEVELKGAKDYEDDKKDLLKKRMAMLSGGIIKLSVGAKTEQERRYLKRKVEDAVCAAQAAIEEGIVPGAGAILLTIAEKVDYDVLKEALRAPYNVILENAGIKPDGKFYNVLTGKEVKDLLAEGIIDPAKVTRCAIENAVSMASTFLTCESATVVEIESPAK
jgi:chaperonin GroEL